MAPIKIEVASIDTKFAILKAAKKLHQLNIKYKTKISIGQDLTIIERQNHKKLLEERDRSNEKFKKDELFYYGIRRNVVCKIYKIQSNS